MLAIVVSMLVGLAAPLFAAEAHAMCTARKHGCGAAPQLVKCCCPDGSHHPADSAPAVAKVEIAPSAAAAPVATPVDAPLIARFVRQLVEPSPPHFADLDRQSLFSSFLI